MSRTRYLLSVLVLPLPAKEDVFFMETMLCPKSWLTDCSALPKPVNYLYIKSKLHSHSHIPNAGPLFPPKGLCLFRVTAQRLPM